MRGREKKSWWPRKPESEVFYIPMRNYDTRLVRDKFHVFSIPPSNEIEHDDDSWDYWQMMLICWRLHMHDSILWYQEAQMMLVCLRQHMHGSEWHSRKAQMMLICWRLHMHESQYEAQMSSIISGICQRKRNRRHFSQPHNHVLTMSSSYSENSCQKKVSKHKRNAEE